MAQIAEAQGKEPAHAITVRRTYTASRERVFAALTKPELLVQWWGPAGFASDWAEIDLRPEGRYRIHMRSLETGYDGTVAGRYLEVEAPSRLVFQITEHCGGAPELFDAKAMAPTKVAIELIEAGSGETELVLTHSGFETTDIADVHQWGWGSSLEKLGDTAGAA